jgi:hypothetical protein
MVASALAVGASPSAASFSTTLSGCRARELSRKLEQRSSLDEDVLGAGAVARIQERIAELRQHRWLVMFRTCGRRHQGGFGDFVEVLQRPWLIRCGGAGYRSDREHDAEDSGGPGNRGGKSGRTTIGSFFEHASRRVGSNRDLFLILRTIPSAARRSGLAFRSGITFREARIPARTWCPAGSVPARFHS